MFILFPNKLRFRYPLKIPLLGLLCCLHTRSSCPYVKPIHWNTSHSFVRNNPLLSLLERCQSLLQLKQIQTQMILTGFINDSFAASRLVTFCALSESQALEYCTKILYWIREPNVFSWNVSIRGFVESGDLEGAVLLYKRMLQSGVMKPDNHTYPCLLKACSFPSMNCVGYTVLGHVLKFGFEFDIFVHNASITMLLSYGELEAAYDVFNNGCVRDLVTWNAMITGCVRRGLANEAKKLYEEMVTEKVKPDEITMIGIISSCSQLQDLNLGRKFHLYVTEHGIELTIPLSNALMDMYVKCGDLLAARILFDKMAHKTLVSWTTMVLGYARFGFLDVARELLYKIPEKSVVPWNAIISGCVQAKNSKEALALFHEMQIKKIKPDKVTMVNCLSACSQLGALDVGLWIHHYTKRHSISLDVALGTALVDMYAKCGNIAKALQVFQEVPQKNCLTWTAIICGLALHGNAWDAISYFSEMIRSGLRPDEITFLGVLSACCHGGLVEEGRKYFSEMSFNFNITPQLKHYSCMVDLLGRAGHLEEAEELIGNMPIAADAAVWGALFFACRVHGNVLIGERAALKLLEMDPQDSGIYVLLATMYSEAKMWKEARNARNIMKERGVEKIPGCSSIEINGIVHEFVAKDVLHPQSEWIYECLVSLTKQLELLVFTCEIPAYGDEFVS
ncbi:pentatricopeptide repeat-containing protein At2g22410, mitochondrial isoform X1 [Vigna radiata var. radiata]|uniref:Pentatricopeptide repeat-containing protein At2g22410, mitochondrial isoform X1 n=1 Tax=Vigna radiata var. radiata TaxID=3916 RepID=A0A1S3UXW1_VIGRR|nr:pentatricopeptide repeat-containing protein At2g22410, mitochondrial isoform X1 [Vigna radiata var. radiata]XP_022640590.1 pentatricopeptide repeat-containing protein At2g22410, mitochondrial isoform X1 [Vigna radiata var. radiata]